MRCAFRYRLWRNSYLTQKYELVDSHEKAMVDSNSVIRGAPSTNMGLPKWEIPGMGSSRR